MLRVVLKKFFMWETRVRFTSDTCFINVIRRVGESIDTYVAALRTLSKTCNSGPLTDNLVRDGIVVGILDKGFQKKLLQESKLTLQSCIDICRANGCTN